MAAVTTLQLVFGNADGRTTSITVQEPKIDLTPAEVQSAMQTIIDKNVFASTGGALVTISAARVISRDVTPLI
jgi:hypothetical protein